ncbi:MAG: GDP-L-fucose synthase [Lentisphaeria bacterium]|nr:GDP-L-fucose synthase [Lentisphaeria bacterium]
MTKKLKVFLAGHKGMVGAAFLREFSGNSKYEIVTINRSKLDLMEMSDVRKYFQSQKFDTVIIASARIGGVQDILENPVDFITDNIVIQANLIMLAHQTGVNNLMLIGSNRLYPIDVPKPIKEESLNSGRLDPNVEPYAFAKIAGIKMIEAYRKQYGRNYFAVMPSNLYGVGDKYEGDSSHVIAGLIQRMHQAMVQNQPSVTIWGSGNPKREFLYVEDFTKACTLLLTGTPDLLTNIGSGVEISIADLAKTLASTIGYKGNIIFDDSKPDGVQSKLIDSSKITKLGFKPAVSLEEGLNFAYMQYLSTNTYNSCTR